MAERPTEAVPTYRVGSSAPEDTVVGLPRTPVAAASNGASSTTLPPKPTQPPAHQTVPPPAVQPVSHSAAQSPDKRPTRSAAGRKARLRLTRLDPWSVMKTTFLLSIAFGIVTIVSVLMVWSVLGAVDVWSSINDTVRDIVGGTSTFDIEDYLGTERVVGFTMIVAAVDVFLITAIATLAAFLYNMSASLLGGIEVTLAEDS